MMEWPKGAPRILCFDIDAAFCQAAYLAWPERLKGVDLLIVGGHPEKRGVVASCTYAARARGVRSGMPMATAIRLAGPDAVAAPVPWRAVHGISRRVFSVIAQHAEKWEKASIDEGYLRLPESDEHPGVTARRIRQEVLDEVGITTSFGVSAVRFIAKMATSYAKPKPGNKADGVFVVSPGTEIDFLDRQQLANIPFVGPAFVEALAMRGVTSVAGARRIDLRTLVQWLKPARAHFLYNRVRALDRHRIGEESSERKSISSESTFEKDLIDALLIDEALRTLVADVGSSLRRMGLEARTVSVKIRESSFVDHQKSRTRDQYVETDRVIYETARELLAELRREHSGAIRLLHVGLSTLSGPGAAEQLTFPEIIPPLETAEDRQEQNSLP
jgi:DNA polymerase-4